MRIFLFLLLALWGTKPLPAQLPFYTDDPGVTQRGKWHFEFFNELDALQYPHYPSQHQNTMNFKLNYGLPYNLEVGLESPYLTIFRAFGTESSTGAGDAGVGVKWNFHKASQGSRLPALGASLYVEFPTGDTGQQLGSGLVDSSLNFIAQHSFSDKTRINGNFGIEFAGNTSTGLIGIQTTRGQVYAGGLSLSHDFSARLTLGGEIYAGIASDEVLGADQLQGMVGGRYAILNGMTLTFGFLAGKYMASPRIGGQIGFTLDFPDILHRPPDR